MLIAVFLEVDDKGEPLYKNKFIYMYDVIKAVKGRMIITEEYAQCIKNIDESIITIIPTEVINEIDCFVERKGDRAKILSVMKNDTLEQFVCDIIQIQPETAVILTCGRYNAIETATKNNNVELYTNMETVENQHVIEDMLGQLDDNRLKLDDCYVENKKLKEVINTKNDYIQQLQVRSSGYENEILRNKAKQEQRDCELEKLAERLNKCENDKMTYLTLYKELLVELDKTKTELMEMKLKLKQKA